MNPNLIEIAYILDRSGSMEALKEAAVSGFNSFLKSQLDVPGDARLTLVLFDDEYQIACNSRMVEEVPELTADTYVPRGSTALLDAIGRTIKELAAGLRALPEDEQPAKVIVAIFTDGLENASREYTSRHVSDLIKRQRDEKGWEFIFLAANQDAIATAASLSMGDINTGNVQFSAAGIKSTKRALGRKVRAMRMSVQGLLNEDAAADADSSMQKLIDEESAEAGEQ